MALHPMNSTEDRRPKNKQRLVDDVVNHMATRSRSVNSTKCSISIYSEARQPYVPVTETTVSAQPIPYLATKKYQRVSVNLQGELVGQYY